MHTKPLYKAIVKSMLGRYSVYVFNLLSMMTLARLFTPELFGTVAAIHVFFIFFQLLSEAGLGPAIINIEKLEEVNRNGIFGLTLLVGSILALVFFSLSPMFLLFFHMPRVDEVVPFISISLFFSTASIIPYAFLLRDQAFFRITKANLAAEVISTSSTILLINWIDPLYCLSAKTSVSTLTSFWVLYYYSVKTEFGRPYIGRKFSAIKPLLSFSMYQFGFNFVNYFSRNLDNILVGKILGSGMLGIYDKAYQLMRYPLMLLTFAMTPAIQPVIKKYAHDIKKVEQIHSSFTLKLSLIGAIVGLVIFLFTDLIVLFMLGKQWSDVIPIINILSLAIPVQIIYSTSGSFYQALNRTDLLFYSGCLSAIVMVTAIVWGVYQYNLIDISWAIVIAFHINFIQTYLVLYIKIFNQGITKFFIQMIPAALLVTGMALWLIHNSCPSPSPCVRISVF